VHADREIDVRATYCVVTVALLLGPRPCCKSIVVCPIDSFCNDQDRPFVGDNPSSSRLDRSPVVVAFWKLLAAVVVVTVAVVLNPFCAFSVTAWLSSSTFDIFLLGPVLGFGGSQGYPDHGICVQLS
jgi:hypothetical protein